MDKYLVSIIIPTFNSLPFLHETLDSIAKQSYQNWECILVDDGSTDETIPTIKSYQIKDDRFQLFKRPKSLLKGASSCRNLGLEKAQGTHIQFFDSDDIMLANHLEDKMKLFTQDSELEVVVNKLAFYEDGEIKKYSRVKYDHLIEDYFTGKVEFYVSGPLWETSFLRKHKLHFDPKTSNLDDWLFNLYALLHEPRMRVLGTSTILYLQHSESLSKKIERFHANEIKSEIDARLKMRTSLSDKNIVLTEIDSFAVFRFIKLFHLCLKGKNYPMAKYCYKSLLPFNVPSKLKVKLWMAYFSYRVFNKGHVFFKDVTYHNSRA